MSEFKDATKDLKDLVSLSLLNPLQSKQELHVSRPDQREAAVL